MNDKKKFIKNIKKIFPLYGKNERVYFKRLVANIDEYDEDHPNSPYSELVEKFGTPKEIYLNYLESQEEDYLIKKVQIRNIVQKVCISCITIVFLLSLCNGYDYFKGYQESSSQRVTEIEITPPEEVIVEINVDDSTRLINDFIKNVNLESNNIKTLKDDTDQKIFCLYVNDDPNTNNLIYNYVKKLENEGYKAAIYDATISSTFEIEYEGYKISITMISDINKWKEIHKDEMNTDLILNENVIYEISCK